MGALSSRRCAALLGALALWASATIAHAQAASESTVKAAFLYKFAGYVEWPPAAFPAADTPFVIGVAGADEVATELERLVPGRQVNGRAVQVRRVREGDSGRGLHILFAGREGNWRNLMRIVQQQAGLVVTDAERGLEQGAAINFVPVDDRVGFEVSLDNAERGGLRISSRMLAVARRVLPRS